jgi:hypothetical protein
MPMRKLKKLAAMNTICDRGQFVVCMVWTLTAAIVLILCMGQFGRGQQSAPAVIERKLVVAEKFRLDLSSTNQIAYLQWNPTGRTSLSFIDLNSAKDLSLGIHKDGTTSLFLKDRPTTQTSLRVNPSGVPYMSFGRPIELNRTELPPSVQIDADPSLWLVGNGGETRASFSCEQFPTERLRITLSDKRGQARIWLSDTTGGASFLSLLGRDDRPRTGVEVLPRSGSRMSFFDPERRARLEFTADGAGNPIIKLNDPAKKESRIIK